MHTADVKKVLKAFSIEVPARDHDDLKEDPIVVKLRKVRAYLVASFGSSGLILWSPPLVVSYFYVSYLAGGWCELRWRLAIVDFIAVLTLMR